MVNVLVSVIIPVFNVKSYISRCLKSILYQTYRDIEIIIIDDGSTDGSDELADTLCKGDSRVRIIHQVNSGPSVSRNLGIKLATGKYVLFVDSDDWLDENCIMALLNSVDEQTELVLFPYIREYRAVRCKTFLFNDKEFLFKNYEMLDKRLLLRLLGQGNFGPATLNNLNTVWGKFYLTKTIKDIDFVDTKKIGSAEDCLFNIMVCSRVKNIKYISSVFYHYNKINQNAFTVKYKQHYSDQRWLFYQLVTEWLMTHNYSEIYRNALNSRIVLELFEILLNVVMSTLSNKEKYQEINRILHDIRYEKCFKLFDFSTLSFVWRIFFFFVVHKCTFCVLHGMSIAYRLRRRFK